MAKVWINPAFKDKFSAKEAKKEKFDQEKTKENKVERAACSGKRNRKERRAWGFISKSEKKIAKDSLQIRSPETSASFLFFIKEHKPV